MGVILFITVLQFYLFLSYMRKWSLVKHSSHVHVFNICGYY